MQASVYSAPTSSGALDAVLSLPGSKSLTNRELVLAAIADGPSRLRAPLHARDTALMVEALEVLGASIEEVDGGGAFGPDWIVTPIERRRIDAKIMTGLAGTVMRFVPPLAALAEGTVVFDGDEHARRRPMSTMTTALRDLGMSVEGDALPFTVTSTGRVRGGSLRIDASASSQFVSGLLLAGARFEEGLRLEHTGERLPSMPHIEMTVQALAERGVEVTSPEPGTWIVPPGPIAARDLAIEPDLSNAAPFLAAALVSGGSVTITGWPERTTQVGDELRWLLERFGGEVTTSPGAVTVRGTGRILPVDLDLSIGGELAPTLVGLAALAEGPSRITGIGHLRGHETDRLAALAAELTALGGDVTELDEGLEIRPVPLHGGPWRSYADHRMATTGALIGLAVPGVEIDDIATTSKTLPEFVQLWDEMLSGGAGSR